MTGIMKKIVILLVAMMLFVVFPISVFAASAGEESIGGETVYETPGANKEAYGEGPGPSDPDRGGPEGALASDLTPGAGESDPTTGTDESSDVTATKAMSAGIAIAVVAAVGALSMGLAIMKSVDGISRQPEASDNIRTSLMLGLVFVETAIIYALIVAILIIFVL